MSGSHPPEILTIGPCWNLLLPLEPLLLLAASLLEPSLTIYRQPPRSQDFWMLLVPGLTTTALCNTDLPLHCVDTAIPYNKGARSVHPRWCTLTQAVLCGRGIISHEHSWEVIPDLHFNRDPEETEIKRRLLPKKLCKGGISAYKFPTIQPEVADSSEGMQVPSARFRLEHSACH